MLGILKMESFWHKLPEFWPQSSVWIQPKSCLVSIISFAATTLLHRVLLQCFRHALCLNFSAVLSFRSCGDFKLPAPLLLLLLELLLLLRWLHIAELTHPRDETGNTKCRLEKKCINPSILGLYAVSLFSLSIITSIDRYGMDVEISTN